MYERLTYGATVELDELPEAFKRITEGCDVNTGLIAIEKEWACNKLHLGGEHTKVILSVPLLDEDAVRAMFKDVHYNYHNGTDRQGNTLSLEAVAGTKKDIVNLLAKLDSPEPVQKSMKKVKVKSLSEVIDASSGDLSEITKKKDPGSINELWSGNFFGHPAEFQMRISKDRGYRGDINYAVTITMDISEFNEAFDKVVDSLGGYAFEGYLNSR